MWNTEQIHLKILLLFHYQPHNPVLYRIITHLVCLIFSIQMCFCVRLLILASQCHVCDLWKNFLSRGCGQWRSVEVNLCKLYSRWYACTSGRSGPSPCWSQTTGSCLKQRSRTCSWTSSRCHVTQHYANSMTSSKELASPRSVLTRLRLYSEASGSVRHSGALR